MVSWVVMRFDSNHLSNASRLSRTRLPTLMIAPYSNRPLPFIWPPRLLNRGAPLNMSARKEPTVNTFRYCGIAAIAFTLTKRGVDSAGFSKTYTPLSNDGRYGPHMRSVPESASFDKPENAGGLYSRGLKSASDSRLLPFG